MSVTSRTQCTTSFVTSLNCSVMYLSFSLCPTFVLLLRLAVSAICFQELLGLMNNSDVVFDFCGKIMCCFILVLIMYVWLRTTASLSPKVSIVGRRYMALHGRSLAH